MNKVNFVMKTALVFFMATTVVHADQYSDSVITSQVQDILSQERNTISPSNENQGPTVVASDAQIEVNTTDGIVTITAKPENMIIINNALSSIQAIPGVVRVETSVNPAGLE